VEKKVFLTLEGQECQQGDLNDIGDVAARADDRVLWELLRLLPNLGSGIDRAVLPCGFRSHTALPGLALDTFVQGGTPDRIVKVLPFRAIVGPIALSPAIENLRGIRSGYCVGGSGNLYSTVTISQNADPSNPRWTLIYAAVTPDLGSAPQDRFVKDAVSDVVAAVPITVAQTTSVSLGTVDGVAAATPTKPATPADASGVYFIPLAYVWVPASFGASGTIQPGYIHESAPTGHIHSALGVANLKPANEQYKVGGTVDSRQSPFTTTKRPAAYLPSTMIGAEERLIALELKATHSSHADGDVVDDSIDWRFRVFQSFFGVGFDASGDLATTSPGALPIIGATPAFSQNGNVTCSGWQFGQSLQDDTAVLHTALIGASPVVTISDGQGIALWIDQGSVTQLGTSRAAVVLYVRSTDGALILRWNTAVTNGSIFIWLRASGQYANYRP